MQLLEKVRYSGGNHSSGPIALLSGLNPQPSSLVAHFFMVALFGMGRLPMKKGLHGIWLAFMLLLVAVRIIVPIICAEGIRCDQCLPVGSIGAVCARPTSGTMIT